MLMVHPHPEFQFTHHMPYGAILHEKGVQFVVFSRNATEMRLLLYDKVADREPAEIIYFDRQTDRWGDVWSVFVPGIHTGQLYHFQADGPHDPEHGLLFDGKARLIDPYAKALAGTFQRSDDGIIRPPKCVVVDDYYNWEGDRHLKRDLSETVIYEMHVKGFTADGSSKAEYPGSYLGVIEKIPYLQSLGVTAVELMPVHEFPINLPNGKKPKRRNYWGYDPMAFFAPHRGYAVDDEPGSQVFEFKQMVRALHRAGIEVILDVVFNHTCEGNELGPTLSFKGLENQVYYMLAGGGGHYKNYTGCGNTINGNHPVVREMIFHCLRHWVHNYHIDGFRFDLASILSRNQNGEIMPNPPVIDAISQDPMLADTKVIAEAWDAAGAYQVGSFHSMRWAEWNGRYRDDVRRFWRGDSGMLGAFATRISGSSDLFQPSGRQPYHSINFVTSHDGFTLNDLVSYTAKHNEANGESNRDGDNNNFSMNYGVEGPTKKLRIQRDRVKTIKCHLATLLLSQGVPMLVMGDEVRRTQRGNNNAYCQDNELSWFDWDLVKKHDSLLRYARELIKFRRSQPTLRRTTFLQGQIINGSKLPDVSWYSSRGTAVDWHGSDLAMTCLLAKPPAEEDPQAKGRDILLMFNSNYEPQRFLLPELAKGRKWRLVVDSSAKSPGDVFAAGDGPRPPKTGVFEVDGKSVRCYMADL